MCIKSRYARPTVEESSQVKAASTAESSTSLIMAKPILMGFRQASMVIWE